MAILSPIAFREECELHGLTPPASMAQDSPEAEAFFDEYSEKYPWIRAVRDYRKSSKHLSTIETMRARERGDGWMSYGLKYGGAHTMRDSGDSGLNLQNLPKGIVSGVDVRSKIKAPEGYTLAIVDLSQIEPRCLHWLAGDTDTLKYIREIPDLYEAQARAWGIWNGKGSMKKEAPEVRHMMKQLALGLGYGMGANKFTTVASVRAEEALRLTNLYRNKNPKVIQLWRKLELVLKKTAKNSIDKDAFFTLPSGRKMTYRAVSSDATGERTTLKAFIPRQGKMMELKYWGGILTENLVQACARDVFMDCCLRIESAGIPVIMRVHDEVVCLVKESEAEEKLKQIIEIMSTPPEWASGLPLGAEGGLSKVYKK
jgi:DNA polymerase